jgi:hypothetical protein
VQPGKSFTLFSRKVLLPTFTLNMRKQIHCYDCLRAGRPRGRNSSPGRVKNFLSSTSSRLALGSTQPPIQLVSGALSPGVKRPEREADHSPPNSAEVRNTWIYTSLPHTSSWRGASLVKHRDNFTFYSQLCLEDGGSTFLTNICEVLPNYVTSHLHTRRHVNLRSPTDLIASRVRWSPFRTAVACPAQTPSPSQLYFTLRRTASHALAAAELSLATDDSQALATTRTPTFIYTRSRYSD